MSTDELTNHLIIAIQGAGLVAGRRHADGSELRMRYLEALCAGGLTGTGGTPKFAKIAAHIEAYWGSDMLSL